jgi:hypothetical protein
MRLLALSILVLVGCRQNTGAGPGALQAEWTGHTAGSFQAPLTATHCPATGIVELFAVRGDTGVGGAVFLRDSSSVAAGEYPVFLGATFPEPRPGAVAALRWFNVTSITAYEGLRGTIRLEPRDSLLTGSFDVVVQGIEHPDTLKLTGRFTGVPLVRADTGCGRTMRRNTL